MSGSLESLQNPLERLSVLPTTMSWRSNPVTNDPTWNVSLQYFYNDVVISGVNEGAYIFTGGPSSVSPPLDHLWTLRGGVDPALDTNGYWQKLTQTGVETSVSATPTFTLSGAAGAQTVVVGSGSLQGVSAGSKWLVTLSFAGVWGAVQTVAELLTFSIASNGTSGTTDVNDVPPIVGSVNNRGSCSFIVSAGTNPPAQIDLTLTATVASTSSPAVALSSLAGSLVWLRLE